MLSRNFILRQDTYVMQTRPVKITRVRLVAAVETARPRLRLQEASNGAKPTDRSMIAGGRYFDREPDVVFFTSGCKLVDLAIGGGWAERRISNIVGDKSSGKTQMAIEAMANYHRKYPDTDLYKIRYEEVEDAFDDGYAESLGLPLDRVKRRKVKIDTVQQFEKAVEVFCDSIPKGGGGLYVLDSLDALSDADEIDGPKIDKKTGLEKGTYGTGKAKAMSRMFRRLVRRIGKANVHLMIVSQLRDKLNVTFGERHTRAGGRALDFYASQVVWLAVLGKIKGTRGKVKRTIGIDCKIMVKKNKVALPFREAEYPILFAYGIDDVQAALDWLNDCDRLSDAGFDNYKAVKAYMRDFHEMAPDKARKERREINKVLKRVWYEIESRFLPPQGKYE